MPPVRPSFRCFVAALSSLVVANSCGSGSPEQETPSGPAPTHSVLLISLDTLRADRMGLYGYDRPTTPALESFATGATRYDRAVATSPWTLPSHGSIFTGLYPYEHGARTYPLDELEKREDFSNAAALDERYETVAELLRDAGYRTGAVVANVSFMDPKWGLAQGFDHYDYGRGKVQDINERALEWLSGGDDEQPFFLFLNYMDTHRPYNVDPIEGFPDLGRRRSVLKQIRPLLLGGEAVPDKLLDRLSDEYDLAVANLDAGLGELFDALRDRGRFDDTLIVVVSDHGEFLGEHQLIEHAKEVYEEVVHVPLIIKEPGQSEGRVDAQRISHVHLPRIILEFTARAHGIPEPMTSHWPRGPVYAEIYGARLRELEEEWGPRLNRLRRAVVLDDIKYVDSSDGERELYDLSVDASERTNLIDVRPELAKTMAEMLELGLLSRTEGKGAGAVRMTPDDLENMRAMGYAGGNEEEEE
jgi:arylsulfatase A-like enzyme